MPRGKTWQKETIETFYFTVDDWYREYRFGINRHPWEYSPDHNDEHDRIIVIGNLRNPTRRKIDRGEMHLLATHISRDDRSSEAERIGNAWVDKGKLSCSAWIPADAFHSLAPTLAAGKFKEMAFTVCNLRYNKGAMENIRLDYELTPLEVDE